jgi:hypothetical protein
MEAAPPLNERCAGWPLKRWCAEVGISVPTYHNIEPKDRPDSVLVGSKRIIIESPLAWLKRITARGGIVTRRQRAKLAEAASE